VSELLETALGIGHRIADQAFWHEGRCSWVGIVPAAAPAGGTAPRTAAALGADLYGGTSGVGLFLAHLYDLTGDTEARRAGIGAIRHALVRVADLRPDRPLALFTGPLGVALAAARCGALLGEGEVLEAGAALGDGLLGGEAPALEPDLVSGAAGAVAGLLALAAETGDARYAARASELGRRLAAGPRAPHLTGMAHGAAGVVHALLALHALTGDEAALAAAGTAAAGEARLFDPATGNWPDLRERGAHEPGEAGAASGMAWCHGAPGTLLSRGRAAERLGAGEAERMGAAAATVGRWVGAAVATRPGNLSLCHGLAGTAECLRDGEGTETARRLALEVAALGIEEHGGGREPWPCGTPGGETPALMVGLAGIGLFYLRLHDERIPSVLAPAPGRLAVTEGRSSTPR
jgi:lantibiotic modifying enzyme